MLLISGPTALTPPPNVRVTRVITAQEMRDAVMHEISSMDIFISVAAVADYRVAQSAPQKIKKQDDAPVLTLTLNPDILAEVAALSQPPFCVGFAAETENLTAYADSKRLKKNLPLIVANNAQKALGQDESELILIDAQGNHPLPHAKKLVQARKLIAHIASLL